MLEGPLLMSLTPGIIAVILSWWFYKKRFHLFVRLLPAILLTISAGIIFYIGYVHVRGFQGGAYLLLGFFLIIFAFISFVIGKRL
ncbi:hypothetical protein [Virgibacillus sp. MSJ-26]|uniref:hypothetical protein n=1 Tax=Virgibacillus sp. MSJ-26 TaxID=2841522 RepID=UPI00209DA661|nr:hypothetical protein [Virgibacillus sp. MSJ-26]